MNGIPSSQDRARRPRWAWAGSLALLLGGTLVALVLAEAGVRILERNTPTARNDRPLFYYKPPGNQGMMDVGHRRHKPPGVFRIVGLGDSITFGLHLQYDDVFLKRLERMLNLNGGRPVEAINLAQPGLSSFQEVADLDDAFSYDPDLVLLGYCLNDPELKGERTSNRVRHLDSDTWKDRSFSGGEAVLAELWHTYRLAAVRLHNLGSRRRYVEYFRRLYRDDFRGWDLARKSLAEMAGKCRKRNVPFAVVVFPLLGAPLRDGEYPFTDIHAKVGEVLGTIGVPVLDLYPSFKDIPNNRLEVLPGVDRHYSEIGHRLAAEAIYEFLLERGLVPGELAIPAVTNMRVMKKYKPSY